MANHPPPTRRTDRSQLSNERYPQIKRSSEQTQPQHRAHRSRGPLAQLAVSLASMLQLLKAGCGFWPCTRGGGRRDVRAPRDPLTGASDRHHPTESGVGPAKHTQSWTPPRPVTETYRSRFGLGSQHSTGPSTQPHGRRWKPDVGPQWTMFVSTLGQRESIRRSLPGRSPAALTSRSITARDTATEVSRPLVACHRDSRLRQIATTRNPRADRMTHVRGSGVDVLVALDRQTNFSEGDWPSCNARVALSAGWFGLRNCFRLGFAVETGSGTS